MAGCKRGVLLLLLLAWVVWATGTVLEKQLSVKAWMTPDVREVDLVADYVQLMAEIKLGQQAFTRAEVRAIMREENGAAGMSNDTILVMRDDGTGGDDVPDDGVYVTSLTSLPNTGVYEFTVQVGNTEYRMQASALQPRAEANTHSLRLRRQNDDDYDEEIHEEDTTDLQDDSDQLAEGIGISTINVTSLPYSGHDTTPPSGVKDLTVTHIEVEDSSFILEENYSNDALEDVINESNDNKDLQIEFHNRELDQENNTNTDETLPSFEMDGNTNFQESTPVFYVPGSMGGQKVYISLEWTTPGDNLDQGTVSDYIFRMSTNEEDLTEEGFDVASPVTLLSLHQEMDDAGLWKEANTSVTLEFYAVNLKPDVKYYLAMKAVDEANNTGKVSNVVVVYFSSQSEPNNDSDDTVEATSTKLQEDVNIPLIITEQLITSESIEITDSSITMDQSITVEPVGDLEPSSLSTDEPMTNEPVIEPLMVRKLRPLLGDCVEETSSVALPFTTTTPTPLAIKTITTITTVSTTEPPTDSWTTTVVMTTITSATSSDTTTTKSRIRTPVDQTLTNTPIIMLPLEPVPISPSTRPSPNEVTTSHTPPELNTLHTTPEVTTPHTSAEVNTAHTSPEVTTPHISTEVNTTHTSPEVSSLSTLSPTFKRIPDEMVGEEELLRTVILDLQKEISAYRNAKSARSSNTGITDGISFTLTAQMPPKPIGTLIVAEEDGDMKERNKPRDIGNEKLRREKLKKKKFINAINRTVHKLQGILENVKTR